ncbi:uncharacterized protein LOC112551878 [Alligator sinensis]|uniref:Uncharacterized protein LOC112551878 n=1 Tax=Alligator sinensis TaxID=38654 RepID=A0A3Q0HGQ9_ALLSI|nr:uncharacterized protein LOC112551878 [Alligator sinensis]
MGYLTARISHCYRLQLGPDGPGQCPVDGGSDTPAVASRARVLRVPQLSWSRGSPAQGWEGGLRKTDTPSHMGGSSIWEAQGEVLWIGWPALALGKAAARGEWRLGGKRGLPWGSANLGSSGQAGTQWLPPKVRPDSVCATLQGWTTAALPMRGCHLARAGRWAQGAPGSRLGLPACWKQCKRGRARAQLQCLSLVQGPSCSACLQKPPQVLGTASVGSSQGRAGWECPAQQHSAVPVQTWAPAPGRELQVGEARARARAAGGHSVGGSQWVDGPWGLGRQMPRSIWTRLALGCETPGPGQYRKK